MYSIFPSSLDFSSVSQKICSFILLINTWPADKVNLNKKKATLIVQYFFIFDPLILFFQVCMSLRPRRTTRWMSFGLRCARFAKRRLRSGRCCIGSSGWNTASHVTWSHAALCQCVRAQSQKTARFSSTSSLRLLMWVIFYKKLLRQIKSNVMVWWGFDWKIHLV